MELLNNFFHQKKKKRQDFTDQEIFQSFNHILYHVIDKKVLICLIVSMRKIGFFILKPTKYIPPKLKNGNINNWLSTPFWVKQQRMHHTLSDLFYLTTSLQFSHSAVSDSLWPHGLQHTRPPCPSPTPGVYPNSQHLYVRWNDLYVRWNNYTWVKCMSQMLRVNITCPRSSAVTIRAKT